MKKYTIQAGDTLGSIARKFYNDPMKYKEIIELNHIVNPHVILAGQEIILPGIKNNGSEISEESKVVSAYHEKLSLTLASLQHIMPNASEAHICNYLDALNSQLPKFRINTPRANSYFYI